MGKNGIPLDEAAVFSTVLEGILYGFSVFMFIGTMWSLFNQRSTKDVNRLMVGVACVLLLLSTMHVIADIKRNEDGLVKYRDKFPGGPPVWFADVSQVTFNIKNGIYVTQTCLGDAVVIYRCYVVWQSFWVIMLPLLGLLGVAIGGYGAVYECAKATTNSTNIFFRATGQWITAFYSSTFATNFLATTLLAYRIWSINKSVSGSRNKQNTLRPVLLIVIDTGLLYSVTLLAALICFVRESNGQYVVLDLITPIISIAFYMVIIRIAIQRTSTSRGKVQDLTTWNVSDTPTQPLEVHINHFSESHGGHALSNLKGRGHEDV